MSFPLTRYISRINRSYRQYRRAAIPASILPGAQHKYVEIICNRPGITQEELSDFFAIDKSTVARQLQQMEDAGFIAREPLPEDKRCRGVYPTEKLREVRPLVEKTRNAFSQSLMEALTPEEQENLEYLLNKISEHIKRGGTVQP